MRNKDTKYALIISGLIHACVIASLIFVSFARVDVPLGDEYVSVELVGSGSIMSFRSRQGSSKQLERFTEPSKDKSIGDSRFPGNDSASPVSTVGPEGSVGTSGSKNGNPILAKIRSKIERNKLYPKTAEKMGIEGSPVVKFKIALNGSVANVELAESSGESVLDTAAIETVKRAEPLPYYDDPIKIKISYKLANR